jgi:hypothetical protein
MECEVWLVVEGKEEKERKTGKKPKKRNKVDAFVPKALT